jgi:predicted permease
MGIPIILSFYGAQAVAKGAVINSFDSVNVIIWSVLALEIFGMVRSDAETNTVNAKFRDAGRIATKLLRNFVTNPFIISAVLGLVVSYFQMPILKFQMLDNTLLLAQNTALPLAMVMIGASISLKSISRNLKLVLSASFFKLILSPIVGIVLGMAFGFSGEDLGICMLFGAMPSAVSSYVMAKEMGADEELCAATIGFSTLVSIFTISAFKFILDNIIMKGSIT